MLDDTFLPIVLLQHATLSPDVVQVAAFEPRSYVVGPGIRSVVWVAGCHRRCPGCSQPEFLSFDSGRPVQVSDLWRTISKIPDIDGVCFSGGEPFEHASPLAALARLVHEAGLTVVSYSGYRMEALRADRTRFGELLDEVDLLIDGEFQLTANEPSRWRGSSNQRLHYLTGRIDRCESESPVRDMQITLDASTLRFSGILPRDFVQLVRRNLTERGFPSDNICPTPDIAVSTDDDSNESGASR